MAGMWRELINRLLVWFPQYVTEKTELTLVYRYDKAKGEELTDLVKDLIIANKISSCMSIMP